MTEQFDTELFRLREFGNLHRVGDPSCSGCSGTLALCPKETCLGFIHVEPKPVQEGTNPAVCDLCGGPPLLVQASLDTLALWNTQCDHKPLWYRSLCERLFTHPDFDKIHRATDPRCSGCDTAPKPCEKLGCKGLVHDEVDGECSDEILNRVLQLLRRMSPRPRMGYRLRRDP